MVVIIYRHVPKRHVNFETTNYGIGQGVNVVVNCVPHSESEWTNQTLSGTKQQKFPTPFRLCSFKQALTNLTLTVCIFRAADWKLDAPDWTGRMRVTARGKVAYVKLEDKISGERKADETAPLFSFLAGNPSVALFFFFFLSANWFLLVIHSKVTYHVHKEAVYVSTRSLHLCLRPYPPSAVYVNLIYTQAG